MKKVAVFIEVPGMTSEHYNTILAELKEQGKFPGAERPSHAAFPKGDAWCVIDVWNSEEALMNFGKNTLFPIMSRLGLQPPMPVIYPVHHFMGNAVEEYLDF